MNASFFSLSVAWYQSQPTSNWEKTKAKTAMAGASRGSVSEELADTS